VTLDQIKRHPYYPFRDFRTNDLSFLMLELYWAELFRTVLTESGDYEAIEKWIPQAPADRQDSNPILDLMDRSTSRLRELRIIQRFNTEDLPELDLDNPAPIHFSEDAYVPFAPGLTYGATDEDGSTPVDELVISSDISEACERLNREFIKKWCVDRVSVEAMQQALDDYWNFVRKNLIESPATS